MNRHYIKIQRNFWKYTAPAWIRNNTPPRGKDQRLQFAKEQAEHWTRQLTARTGGG